METLRPDLRAARGGQSSIGHAWRNGCARLGPLVALLFCVASILAEESSRSVRISFLPPPLEGTISLGIYDRGGKLVRVLHREAELEEFRVGADALITTWDGKGDDGRDLPSGRYSARGYAVGEMKIDETSRAAGEAIRPNEKVTIKLVPNPLAHNERQSVEILAGFDEESSFVQTADGLPLFTVDECPAIFAATVSPRGDHSLEFIQSDGDTVDQFQISGLQNMMGFDAGEFELK